MFPVWFCVWWGRASSDRFTAVHNTFQGQQRHALRTTSYLSSSSSSIEVGPPGPSFGGNLEWTVPTGPPIWKVR